MRARFKDFYELCKPRVVLLMLITSAVSMLLATPSANPLPIYALIVGNIGIALLAFAGGVTNHFVDRRIDVLMARTQNRPLATGRVTPRSALILAIILAIVGFSILFFFVNALSAFLSFATLIGYAVIYTLFLKRATPQNIVIGGLAGAMPPLLGWTAVTNHIDAGALLLVAIIFTWTPPHFWALSIFRFEDYKKAEIPMLPVTHGIHFTKVSILLYTFLMVGVTYLPFAIDFSGILYLVGVSLLNVGFLFHAIRLYRSENPIYAWKTFKYSITYLGLLFILLLADHYLAIYAASM